MRNYDFIDLHQYQVSRVLAAIETLRQNNIPLAIRYRHYGYEAHGHTAMGVVNQWRHPLNATWNPDTVFEGEIWLKVRSKDFTLVRICL